MKAPLNRSAAFKWDWAALWEAADCFFQTISSLKSFVIPARLLSHIEKVQSRWKIFNFSPAPFLTSNKTNQINIFNLPTLTCTTPAFCFPFLLWECVIKQIKIPSIPEFQLSLN